jgi:thymidylate synthase
MKAYSDILNEVLTTGELDDNRTDTKAYRIPGAMFKHDMRTGFPLLTTKKINPQTVFTELEFFIKGLSDKQWLKDRGCNIWNEWCNPKKVPYGNDEDTKQKMVEENDLGRCYGVQWVSWLKYTCTGYDSRFGPLYSVESINQLKNAIETLKKNPTSRRNIVTAWNPAELDQMALPPCHKDFQFFSNGDWVDLHWSQRSVDTFLGLPFNIASYGLLLELVAKHVGMTPRYLIGHLGDVHLYENHVEQAKLQLSRETLLLPKLILPDNIDIFTWESNQFQVVDYQHHAFIKAPIAV